MRLGIAMRDWNCSCGINRMIRGLMQLLFARLDQPEWCLMCSSVTLSISSERKRGVECRSDVPVRIEVQVQARDWLGCDARCKNQDSKWMCEASVRVQAQVQVQMWREFRLTIDLSLTRRVARDPCFHYSTSTYARASMWVYSYSAYLPNHDLSHRKGI